MGPIYWCTWRKLKRYNSGLTKVCQRHAFSFRAESTQANDYIPRSVDPMFRRRHRNNNIARLPLDELDRSCGLMRGEPLGFWCSCLNAQMIGRIAVASRRPSSLPRLVGSLLLQWPGEPSEPSEPGEWAFLSRRVVRPPAMCIHYLHRYSFRKVIFPRLQIHADTTGFLIYFN